MHGLCVTLCVSVIHMSNDVGFAKVTLAEHHHFYTII